MDSAVAIARDLIAEIGRWNAVVYVARQVVTASTPRASWQGVRLLWAVLLG